MDLSLSILPLLSSPPLFSEGLRLYERLLLQVSGDAAPLHPQAASPAARAGVVAPQAGRPQARILRLHRGVRVGQGAGVVEPDRGAYQLGGGGRGAGVAWGLGSKSPGLEGAEGGLAVFTRLVVVVAP